MIKWYVLCTVMLALAPGVALAGDCKNEQPDSLWCDDGWAASLAAPVGLSFFGLDKVWVASANSLLGYNSTTGVLEEQTTDMGSVAGRAMPFEFSPASRAIFVASQDGYLYRRDAGTGACVWKTYLGRTDATDITPGCAGSIVETCSFDSLTGMPAVRPGANEASAIVYAGTHTAASLGSSGALSHPSIDVNTSFTQAWAVTGTSTGQVIRINLPF